MTDGAAVNAEQDLAEAMGRWSHARSFTLGEKVRCVVTGRPGVVARVYVPLRTTPDCNVLIEWASGQQSVERATMLRHDS